MGGVSKAINKIFGGGSAKVSVPEVTVPDYEAERQKAEEEALQNRNRLRAKGMSGTILGGSLGDAGSVRKKKLLGE